MSDLYNIVNEIVNSNSDEESRELLYNSGLLDSSSEYYKSIVTSFINKKEDILPKQGNTVIYDIEKDIDDMIDILFIWKYIEKEWKNEQKEIKKEKDLLKNQRKKETDPVIKQEISDKIDILTNNSNEINKNLQAINTKNVYIKDINNKLDNEKLKNELIELKKAINMIVKIRNSLSHRNNKLIISDDLIISNDMKIKIPIEYIEGFNKSQITPKEEDKKAYSEAATIAELIMKYIDKDPRKITSFFASVEPSVLSFMLDSCSNDLERLYQVPIELFYMDIQELISIVKFAYKEKLNSETVQSIAKYYKKDSIHKIIDIYDYLKEKNDDDNRFFFNNLAKGSYYNKKNIDKIINLFEKENIDKKLLKYVYPSAGFNINNFREIYLFIKNNNIDFEVLKYIKYEAYEDSKNTIEILKYMKDNNYDYNILKNTLVPNEQAFYSMYGKYKYTNFYSNKSSTAIKLLEYIKNNNLSENKIKYLMNRKIEDFDEFIKVANYFEKENIEFNDLLGTIEKNKSIDSFIKFYELLKIEIGINENNNLILFGSRIKKESDVNYLIELVKVLNNYNISYKSVFCYRFNDVAKESKNLINSITFLAEEKKLDIEIVKRIIRDASESITNNTFIRFIENNNIPNEVLKNINSYSYKNLTKLQVLINLLKENNIDLNILKVLGKKTFDNPKETVDLIIYIRDNQIDIRVLKYLNSDSYKSLDKTKKLLKFVKDSNINPSVLEELPANAYSHSDDFKGIINYMLKENISLDLIKYIPRYDVSLLNNKHDNIKFLSNLVSNNYKKIKEYPKEFFIYDIGIIDKALSEYNNNIIKSIFGTNDYKMIASIIYANNVLTNNSVKLGKKEKKQVFSYIFKNINKFTEEIVKINKNRKDFSYKQMIIELSGWAKKFAGNQKINGNEFIDYFIEKTRNSSAHIRYKPSAVKGFIHLYDQDNDGNINFSIDIKPEYLVEITHIVEESLNKEKIEDKGKTR